MAAKFHKLAVSGIVQETHDSRSFMFNVPSELRADFQYKAGQFLTFQIPWDDMEIRRCYSLASAPETDGWHKVTVKRVDGGRVSNWMNDNLKVGDLIDVQAPEGRFVLKDGHDDRPLTLFGGGSGITPVISLLKSALATTTRDVVLVYANRDEASTIFQDELERIVENANGRARVIHHRDAESGFMTPEGIRDMITGRENSDCYVCGPGPFMDTVEKAFELAGIDSKQTHFERFVSPLDPDRKEANPADEVVVAEGDTPESFTIKLDGKTMDIPYVAGETLLKSASQAGVDSPYSCEEGYCGCCMAMMTSGKVHMPDHEALTEEDIAKGWILPCQAKPTSNEALIIDYDAEY